MIEQHVLVGWPAPGLLALTGKMLASFILGMLSGHWEFISFSLSDAVFLLPRRAKSWGAARGQLRHRCVRGLPLSLLSPSLGLYLPGGRSTEEEGSESITFIYLSLAVTGKLMLMDSFFSLLSGTSFSPMS